VEAGVRAQFAGQFTSGGGQALNNLAGVGDLGAAILAQVPEAVRPQVEPLIPAIVDAIYEAFSIATAATFVMGIASALLAALVVLVFMPKVRAGAGAVAAATVPSQSRGELEPAAD
jgi:hypothetical protein